MKAILALCVVIAVGFTNGAVVQPPTSRSSLSVGYVYAGDRLLHRQYLYRPAIANAIQYQDLVFRGNQTTRITAIRASEVGYTQYASAWILSGGVGYPNVTIRVQSARGYGYYVVIDIWGR